MREKHHASEEHLSQPEVVGGDECLVPRLDRSRRVGRRPVELGVALTYNGEDLGPEDYLNLIMLKTCWYTTIDPLRVGAMVRSGGKDELAPLARIGFHFGAAFQIRDDLLNLVGDERTYGKEILGDRYEGKRTLPLVHLLASARGTDRAMVRDYLRRERAERSPEQVRAVRTLMDEYGSIAFTTECAERILPVAEEYFEEAFTDAEPRPDLDFLRALVPYVWARWR